MRIETKMILFGKRKDEHNDDDDDVDNWSGIKNNLQIWVFSGINFIPSTIMRVSFLIKIFLFETTAQQIQYPLLTLNGFRQIFQVASSLA